MSEGKQICQVNDCNRGASTRCYCCNKSICARHFIEHIDAVTAQVDPLANEINTMLEKIRELTIEHLTKAPLEKLAQWKNEMHQLIDEIFLIKIKETESLVDENRERFSEHKKQLSETVMKMQEEVRQLAEDGDATSQQIEELKKQLAGVEANRSAFQNNFLSINTEVCGQNFVTVSSTLNQSSSIPNTQIPPRSLLSAVAAIPVSLSFGTSSFQPFDFHNLNTAFQTTSSMNRSGSNVLSFGAESTMTAFGGLPSTSTVSSSINDNPFSTERNCSTNSRPVFRAKRRPRP